MIKPIPWQQTVASQCRWSEVSEIVFDSWTILWENSENDYSGQATIFGVKEGQYRFLQYDYGSCSGCDSYEDMSAAELKRAFDNLTLTFQNTQSFCNWMIMVRDTNNRRDPKALAWEEYRQVSAAKALLNSINDTFGSTDWLNSTQILENRINALMLLT